MTIRTVIPFVWKVWRVKSDPALLTLVEASSALADGSLTSQALVEACLDRIRVWQPARNAFIAVNAQDAIETARERDTERRNGYIRGPLHGIPLAHKDMFYRKGAVSTGGSRIRRDWKADCTATVLTRLDDAGAIDLGRLNMSEFAAYATGENPHYGHCHNAYAQGFIAGGSSSGSGTAIAARLAYGALGSDTGGSIRVPASANGIVGLKPTYGRVSRYGALPRSWTLDHVGPMARTAADCALMLSVIAGKDPLDPTTSSRAAPSFERFRTSNAGDMVVGYADPDRLEIAPEVAAVYETTLRQIKALKVPIRPVQMPDFAPMFNVAEVIIKSEAASLHRQWFESRAEDYFRPVHNRLAAGFEIPAVDYIDAVRLRSRLASEFVHTVFAGVDIVLLPTLSVPVPRISDVDISASHTQMRHLLGGLTKYTRPFNLLGFPALSMPAGFTESGLPCGVQLIGRPYEEFSILSFADYILSKNNLCECVPKLSILV